MRHATRFFYKLSVAFHMVAHIVPN